MRSGEVKKLKTNYDLYELLSIFRKIHYRIIFIVHQNKYKLIHAFDKNWANPTPPKDIQTAINRVKMLIK